MPAVALVLWGVLAPSSAWSLSVVRLGLLLRWAGPELLCVSTIRGWGDQEVARPGGGLPLPSHPLSWRGGDCLHARLHCLTCAPVPVSRAPEAWESILGMLQLRCAGADDGTPAS